MRIPITTHPNHICLHPKDISYFFGTKILHITKQMPQYQMVQYTETLYVEHQDKKIELCIYSCHHKQSEIHISSDTAKRLHIEAPLQLPGNLHNAKGVKISSADKSLFFPANLICPLSHITMSQADAEEYGFYQGQKISAEIPYKNIEIPNLKVKIKDYFQPDFYIMEDDAKQLKIQTHERLTPVLRP